MEAPSSNRVAPGDPIELGLAALGAGNLGAALDHFQEASRAQPDSATVLHHLGVTFYRQKNCEEALQLFHRALALEDDLPDTWLCLGHVNRDLGKLEDAVGQYREVIRLRPEAPVGHLHLGDALAQQGHLADAIASYQECLRLKPDLVGAHHSLGQAWARQGNQDEAEASYRAALSFQPTHAASWNDLGLVYQLQGELVEAESCFRQSLEHNADQPDVLCMLGLALAGQRKPEESIEFYQRAIELDPESAVAHNGIGNVLRDLDRIDEAEGHLKEALRLRWDYAEAHNSLSILRRQQGRFNEVIPGYDRALRFKPDLHEARLNRAMAYLEVGEFDKGWPEFESRWQDKDMRRPNFKQPRWDGTDLRGRTILLWAEQGLGDTLQFIRYAPLVKERGGRVLFGCPRPLTRILAGFPGIDRLFPRGSRTPRFDVQAPLLSLPGLFQTRLETIPANVPYLFPDPVLSKHWREALKHLTGFKVGINWKGNDHYRNDRNRSISLAQFAPLARIPGVHLISLQKGAGAEQLDSSDPDFAVQDLGRYVDARAAFTDTAAIMKQLDLVITSDTAIPHLAGALGVPVWLALPFAACWRWLRDRTDSPWYPTMRLFRQEQHGNWDEVFAHIAAELAGSVSRAAHAPGEGETARTNGRRLMTELEALAGEKPDPAVPTREDPGPLRAGHTPNFPSLLRRLGASVLVTTYQAGRLVMLRAEGDHLNTHYRVFRQPMGLALAGGGARLAIGTKIQIWEFRDVPSVGRRLEPAGTHDACYLPRSSHVTGNVLIHEMAYGADGALWIVNTRFSCLATLDSESSFTPRWRPPFITELEPSDRCHLNGVALVDGKPKYVTALGETNEPAGWRANKATGGILMDVDSSTIVCRGLSMPHSPRWHDGRLWVCESGSGTLGTVDLNTGRYQAVAAVPGFTRGLDIVGDLAFVGLSQVRESAIFSGIPITERLKPEERTCGVSVVDLRRGEPIALLKFKSGVQEIFAVSLLRRLYPDLINDDDKLLESSFVVPTECLDEVSAKVRAE
jgi:uncharacterized protein (TIGR03032 family)